VPLRHAPFLLPAGFYNLTDLRCKAIESLSLSLPLKKERRVFSGGQSTFGGALP
jgi:hypothetical protein